jgi:predicted MFS family arabinose efflux permease
VALPVWVGTLNGHYRFDPQQAGALAPLFLAGAVAASLVFAPRFDRLRGRPIAALAYALAALAFFGASRTQDFGLLAALHALGGLAAGTGLSMTHGTIGRSANPHRLFGIVGAALGVFAVLFLGATPQIVAAAGGPALFVVFGAVMAVAAVVSALLFPVPEGASRGAGAAPHAALPRAVWCGIVAIACMALVQAMVFAFVERIGADRGYSVDTLTAVLIAVGLVNLFPAALAALLQKRLDPRKVVLAGPVVQAALALTISLSSGFAPYAAATAVFVAVMIFTHTFAFGLLAWLDRSGRAVAATPAMLMVGAAIGPILGGTLIKSLGYGVLGIAALLIDAAALLLFARLLPRTRHLGAPA